jgi:hypothetical protein
VGECSRTRLDAGHVQDGDVTFTTRGEGLIARE